MTASPCIQHRTSAGDWSHAGSAIQPHHPPATGTCLTTGGPVSELGWRASKAHPSGARLDPPILLLVILSCVSRCPFLNIGRGPLLFSGWRFSRISVKTSPGSERMSCVWHTWIRGTRCVHQLGQGHARHTWNGVEYASSSAGLKAVHGLMGFQWGFGGWIGLRREDKKQERIPQGKGQRYRPSQATFKEQWPDWLISCVEIMCGHRSAALWRAWMPGHVHPTGHGALVEALSTTLNVARKAF